MDINKIKNILDDYYSNVTHTMAAFDAFFYLSALIAKAYVIILLVSVIEYIQEPKYILLYGIFMFFFILKYNFVPHRLRFTKRK